MQVTSKGLFPRPSIVELFGKAYEYYFNQVVIFTRITIFNLCVYFYEKWFFESTIIQSFFLFDEWFWKKISMFYLVWKKYRSKIKIRRGSESFLIHLQVYAILTAGHLTPIAFNTKWGITLLRFARSPLPAPELLYNYFWKRDDHPRWNYSFPLEALDANTAISSNHISCVGCNEQWFSVWHLTPPWVYVEFVRKCFHFVFLKRLQRVYDLFRSVTVCFCTN